MVLGYLISPVVQIVDSHGKPIVGAKIYVYKAGTTNTVNTYRDFSNHYNPTPVLTNTLGNCTIIAPDDMIYDIVVKDNRNNLLMSKDNLTVSSGINPDINLRFREGYGIIIRKNGNTVTISVDTDVIATKSDLAAKQDKLTAGDNIEITNDNTVNVVNRKTLYTQWPLKVDRGSSMVKLYLDQEFANYTAGTGISIDDNGEISCTGDITPYTAGSNITIDNHQISSKDWTSDINDAATTNNWDVTPYTAGSNITIDNHQISSKDWTSDINDAATTNNWDVTPYTAGSGISINNHVISSTVGVIRQYNVSIPNDGTTVTLFECDTDTDSFVFEGKYNTTNSNYEISIRNTNDVSRYLSVFDSINTFYRIQPNDSATIATPGVWNDTRTRIEIFGMGVGSEKPRGEYSIYTTGYTNRLEVTVYEICAYNV